MNTGLQLSELANRITADRSSNKDYIGDTRHFRMLKNSRLSLAPEDPDDGIGGLSINPLAHQQIAERVGIPFRYYERMLQLQPELLATNVNRWFNDEPAKRLLRTNAGNLRAFLSDGYRPLDNYDVAENLLPKLIDSGLEVVSSQITETRLYIQAKTAKVSGEVKKGDVIQAGVVITNSEVGCGSLSISEFFYRLVCLNGMVGENLVRQAHVGGSRRGDVTMAIENLKTETRIATDKAFWMQARDQVDALLLPGRFDERLAKFRAAAGIEIKDPVKAVEKIVELYSLSEGEGSGILAALAKGGDVSQWGLANAVTAQAHNVDLGYDRSFDFEKLGHKIIELPKNTFGLN